MQLYFLLTHQSLEATLSFSLDEFMYRTESFPSSLEKGLADCHGEERRETLQVKVIMMSQEVSPVTSLRTRHGFGAGERQAFPVGHGRSQQSEPHIPWGNSGD